MQAMLILITALSLNINLFSSFNPATGYIKYAIVGETFSQVATDALIHPDGRILVVGSQSVIELFEA